MPILPRARRLRPLDESTDFGLVFSLFNDLEDMLALSPILVLGVEDEDCPWEEFLTLIALSAESDGAMVLDNAA